MRYETVKDALLDVLPKKVYHFDAPEKVKPPYIVWAEDGQGQIIRADNRLGSQVIEGTIDYFTIHEYDDTFLKIQRALDNHGISYRFNSCQYEKDTKLIHFEWVWQYAET